MSSSRIMTGGIARATSARRFGRTLTVAALGLAVAGSGKAARAADAPPPPPDTPDTPSAGEGARLEPRFAVVFGALAARGQDATDGSTQFGGGYVGGRVWILPKLLLSGMYSASAGGVTERLAAPGGGAVQDVAQNQVRHTGDLTIGWRFDLGHAETRVWLLPYLGLRSLFLVDDVAPVWALEAQGGGRLGVSLGSSFDLSAFGSYGRALTADGTPGVYGNIIAEPRFGADLHLHAAGPLWITLGYEGDIVALEHQNVTYHLAIAGLEARFE